MCSSMGKIWRDVCLGFAEKGVSGCCCPAALGATVRWRGDGSCCPAAWKLLPAALEDGASHAAAVGGVEMGMCCCPAALTAFPFHVAVVEEVGAAVQQLGEWCSPCCFAVQGEFACGLLSCCPSCLVWGEAKVELLSCR
jgi:hypothetical protein